jgi:hypothetical protein
MGFYKFENGEWLHATQSVHFPDGTVLNADNKNSHDGWEWMDEQPIDFQDNSLDLLR